jgi:hypothetical protein
MSISHFDPLTGVIAADKFYTGIMTPLFGNRAAKGNAQHDYGMYPENPT